MMAASPQLADSKTAHQDQSISEDRKSSLWTRMSTSTMVGLPHAYDGYTLRSLRSNPGSRRVLSAVAALCLLNILKASICISQLPLARGASRLHAAAEESSSDFWQQPLMVQLEGANVKPLQFESEQTPLIEDHSSKKRRTWSPKNASRYKYVKGKHGCVPLGDWYDDHHPSCLLFHEIDLNAFFDGQQEQIRVVGIGNIRAAWMIREYDGTKRALKTMKYEKTSFQRSVIDNQRVDAVVMEQLTASHHVADVYGYCSTAAIIDFADEGDLEGYIRKNRTKYESLKVAYDVAAAVADTHHVDSMGRPTIVHRDLRLNQFILIDGVYKLNDFNCAGFLSWNKKRNEYCDLLSTHKASKVGQETLFLCHILHQLLTGRHLSRTHFWNLVLKGKHPNITDEAILKSKHPFDTSVLKALDTCWKVDLRGRPSVRELADLLHQALETLSPESSPKRRLVSGTKNTATGFV